MVPDQWKSSSITLVPKIASPLICQDFRPISVTPVLSRLFEKEFVRQTIYPVLVHPNHTHQFSDQFAFRPTPYRLNHWGVDTTLAHSNPRAPNRTLRACDSFGFLQSIRHCKASHSPCQILGFAHF